MFILIINLDNILNFDMLKHDLWLFTFFFTRITKCIFDHVFTFSACSQTPIFSLDLLLHTLPLMETIDALLKFGQRQNVFINDFVVSIKV
jgi:hypothetical protein